MEENDPQPEQSGTRVLSWILGLAIALVAGAIAWVAWSCIDSLQKHSGELQNYHVTAENTKIDSNLNDDIKKKVDAPVMSEHVDPALAIQEAISAPVGSELDMNKGQKAVDKEQYAQAVTCFSQVLAMIPVEAKKKTSWRTGLRDRDRLAYTQFAYEQRAFCYLKMQQYSLAIVDLTAAIKLNPDYAPDYENRAKAYHCLGEKALEAADVKTLQALSSKNILHP
jgi:tetratricopeptide (TPR) repeat protein